MRVIAGKYRHRILLWPDDAKHIRPTKDRIREAIFGALGDIEGKVVLDLYAGSGAMGIYVKMSNYGSMTSRARVSRLMGGPAEK